MSNFKKITLTLTLAAASAVGTPAMAAMQTVDAVGYTFSFDDVLWGLPGGTSFSSAGNVFTFANLGYLSGSSVTRGGSSNSGFYDALDNSITITAKSGYQITGIVTGASGTVSAIAGSAALPGVNVEASASVNAGVTSWRTDAGYLFATQNVGADVIVSAGASDVRHYSAADTGQFAFAPGTSFAVGSYMLSLGSKSSGAGSAAFASLDAASFSVAVSPVSPVPEPESFALLLSGLALVAATSRRRQHQA